MNSTKYAIIITLLAVAAIAPIDAANATNNEHYEKILKNTNYLNSGLKYEIMTHIANNWNSTSMSQEHTVKNIINSVDHLEKIHKQKTHPQIGKPLQELRYMLLQTKTMSDLIIHQDRIQNMESAINVLDHTKKIAEMLRYNPILDSKQYLHDIWEPIQQKIQHSESIEDIISFQTDNDRMEKIITYNYKIHDNIHSPVFTLIMPEIKSVWSDYKEEMSEVKSIIQMTNIATKYYNQVGKIDSSIISKWEEKIISLKEYAKKQDNHEDLMRIDKNIKNLNMVKKIQKIQHPLDSDAQSKAILYNLSQNYLKIKLDLDEFDRYLENKNEIKQKLDYLQKKANDPYSIKSMPEFEPKIKNTVHHMSYITNALETNDYKYAQQMIDALEREWNNFEQFYPEIRNYTPIYKQSDISTFNKKQIYLEEISKMDALIGSLDIKSTSLEYKKYQKLIHESKASILYGNFDVGHEKIYDALDYASKNFLDHDPRIIMDITYDDSNLLTVNGAIYKHSMNSRDSVLFYLFDQDDKILESRSYTTKHGDFQILLNGKIEPGIYIAQVQYGHAKESQIISIQKDTIKNMVFTQAELSIMELANTFENLEDFLTKFNDTVSENQLQEIQLLISNIKQELADGKIKEAAKSIQEFKNKIKLYVPIQSSKIAIDVSTTDSIVKITGKTAKLVQYREPIFLTIFNQDGKRVYEQMAYDDKYGSINIEIPAHAFRGLAIVQVEYHDFLARDTVEIKPLFNSHQSILR